jgi:mRNA interferase YafQ
MMTISRTARFKRDFKRIEAGQHGKNLDRILADVLTFLLFGKTLPPHYRDHSLSGDYDDCRECHLKPDLLLIYRKLDDQILQLTRIGSHSELF